MSADPFEDFDRMVADVRAHAERNGDGVQPVGAVELLGVLWGSTPGHWSTLSHRVDGSGMHHEAVRTDDRNTWSAWLAEHAGGDCWYRVCPMDAEPDLPAHRGGSAATSLVPALWADLDWQSAKHPGAPPRDVVEAALARLDGLLRPSIIPDTGNGVQLLWLLDEPAEPAEVLSLIARLNVLLEGDPSTSALADVDDDGRQLRNLAMLTSLGLHNDRKNLDSLLRLPGTTNSAGGAVVSLRRFEPTLRYSLTDLDDVLPEPDLVATGFDGVPLASTAEIEEFLGSYTADKYPRALVRAVEQIDATVARNGGARHPSLRLYLWQALSEAMVGAYPARSAVERGFERWRAHLLPGERRPRHELRDLLAWQVPRVKVRTDLAEVRQRLDEVFYVVPFITPTNIASTTTAPGTVNLPEAFWNERPSLAHIRQAAHARGRSADAVLGVVLARRAALTPPSLRLPPIVGDEGGLNLYVALVGPPAAGKSSSAGIGARLVEFGERDDIVDGFVLGSGEGLVDAFLGPVVEEPRIDGTKRKVRRQERTAVFVYVDEGQQLNEMATRNGATLMPTLRQMFMSSAAGQGNASPDAYRWLAPHAYRLAMVVGWQTTYAANVLSDVDGGFPQRVLWLAATDPSIPTTRRVWPGALAPPVPPTITGGHHVTVADAVAEEVWQRDVARSRGTLVVHPLDAHADLVRLKVARGLADLDGRPTEVTEADWRLAGVVMATSAAVRSLVITEGQRAKAEGEQYAIDRAVRREEAIETSAHRRAVESGARSIGNRLHRDALGPDESLPRSVLNQAVGHKYRQIASLDEMIARAIELNFAVMVEPDRYRPGPARPA